MAQSPIRVDTNIVGTKRLFSQNSDDDAEPSVAAEEQESLGIPGLPAFLNLPLPGKSNRERRLVNVVNVERLG